MLLLIRNIPIILVHNLYIVLKQVIGLLLAADSSPSLSNMTVLPPVNQLGIAIYLLMNCSRTLPSNSCVFCNPSIQ